MKSKETSGIFFYRVQLWGDMKRIAVHAILLLAVSACGEGGGNSAPPAPSKQVFAIANPVSQKSLVGFQMNGPISGTGTADGQPVPFSGSAQISVTPATVQTTFNNQSALEGTVTLTGSLTINSQNSRFGSGDNFFVSSTDTPLGDSSATSYCVVTSYSPPPTSGAIGATGMLMTESCYRDSTMSTPTGTSSESYVVSAGPVANTATVGIIDTAVNTSDQIVSETEIDYQVTSAGAITLQDVKESGTYSEVFISFTIQ